MGIHDDDDDRLLEALMADPMTARLLLAWRRSMLSLEQARLTIGAGNHWPAELAAMKPV